MRFSRSCAINKKNRASFKKSKSVEVYKNSMQFHNAFAGHALTNFQPVTLEDIINMLKSAPFKSCDLDPIPPRFNRLHDRAFPLIVRKGKPMPKNWNFAIANLSFISKDTEEALSRQLSSHILLSIINESLQSAYKKHTTTNTASISVEILKYLHQPYTECLCRKP